MGQEKAFVCLLLVVVYVLSMDFSVNVMNGLHKTGSAFIKKSNQAVMASDGTVRE